MATYRYLACDVVTGDLLGELPLTDVSWAPVVNGAGSFTAKLHLGVNRGQWASRIERTTPLRRGIYIERDGQIRMGGLWWTRTSEAPGEFVQLQGAGFWSIFRKRRIDELLEITGDQATEISHQVLTHAMDRPGGGLDLRFDLTPNGSERARTFAPWDRKVVAEAIEDMARAADGFDFSIDCRWSGDRVIREFRTHQPTMGRPLSAGVKLTCATGSSGSGNVASWTWEEIGQDTANEWTVTGDGQAEAMQISTTRRDDLIAEGWPLLQDVYPVRDVADPDALEGISRERSTQRGTALVKASFEVDGQRSSTLAEWDRGDIVTAQIDECPRFPAGIERPLRVASFDCKVDNKGNERVTPTFFEAA